MKTAIRGKAGILDSLPCFYERLHKIESVLLSDVVVLLELHI